MQFMSKHLPTYWGAMGPNHESFMCWHRSGFLYPFTDMSVLVSCCLLQVNMFGMLAMHDQLRDLAYSIVREESSSVAQRTRLLRSDAEHALKTGV